MLTNDQLHLIDKYVDDQLFDRAKLTRYLSTHDIVGSEVFEYCDRGSIHKDGVSYSRWLEYEDGYEPLPIDVFFRRMPFFFYVCKKEEIEYYGSLEEIYAATMDKRGYAPIEKIYSALEFMFYDVKIPLDIIFSYWLDQTGNISTDIFFKWEHYLHLCKKHGVTTYLPKRFITAYNELLEKENLPPIIYEITESPMQTPFLRNGTKLRFEGTFPCTDDGRPIMKWIGIHATNIVSAKCSCEKSEWGILTLEITPYTVIDVLNFYNKEEDQNDVWYQVYAGPKTMQFNYSLLKDVRKDLGYTQQQVADAIDTSVRTYQKWESGETTPDGHYLIRLINWLDITDIQLLTKMVYIDGESDNSTQELTEE